MVPHGCFIGQADVADLAGLDLLVQCFEGVFQGRQVGFDLVLVTQLTEEIGAALWPVQLVQVDVIGLQALEAGVHGFGDVLCDCAAGGRRGCNRWCCPGRRSCWPGSSRSGRRGF